MLYVIAFFMPPLALLLIRKPVQALIGLVCYGLMWCGVVAAMVPGIILFFLPLLILWFGVFWFAPVVYTVAAIKARRAGRAAPQRIDYRFALRRLAVTLLLMVVIPAGARMLFWFYAAHQLREQFALWAKAPDTSARWDGEAVEGFPFVARLRLTNATLNRTKPLPCEVSAPLVIIETSAWVGPDWHIAMPQGAKLDVPGFAIAFDAEAIDADVDFNGRNPTLVNFTAQNVRGGVAPGFHIDKVYGQMQLPGTPSANAQQDFLSLNVNLSSLTLPRALPPLGNSIESAQIMAEVKGAWPPGPLREALAAWRDHGGSIDEISGSLHWGAFEAVVGGATLKLDEALQPIGSLSASTSNVGAAIDAIAAAGGLSGQGAEAAKSALISQMRPAEMSRRVVEAMHIENNRLMLGTTELLTLPRVVWP